MTSAPAEVIRESPLVAMLTAPNPGPKTLSGTHTYVVGRAQGFVIDPGPDARTYQEAIARWLRIHQVAPQGILLTHGHPDHAPGAATLKRILHVPVYASENMPPEHREAAGAELTFGSDRPFRVESDTLRVIATPGHTADHVAFWLEGARILFAGDTVLGEGTTLVAPPEGDMAGYMATLALIDGLGAELIAPGHGPLVTDPPAKIREYVQHRRQREQQIVDALRAGPANVQELVERIYTDVDPRLHALAAGSVEAQLVKLQTEGRVNRTQDRYTLTSL